MQYTCVHTVICCCVAQVSEPRKFSCVIVKGREVEAVVRRLKTDLHNCVGYIQEPKLLKDSIKAMYQKHVQEDMVNKYVNFIQLSFCIDVSVAN